MRTQGFTLIEALFTLLITAILLTMGVPAFSDLIKEKQSKAVLYRLITLVNLTRSHALSEERITTICGSSDQQTCDGQWEQGILVFTDGGDWGKVDGDDTVLRYENVVRKGSLDWRAFQNKPFLQYRPDGFTNYHSGNLTYCPPDRDLTLAKQLIINVAGRARVASDTDGNGIPNDAQNDDISC